MPSAYVRNRDATWHVMGHSGPGPHVKAINCQAAHIMRTGAVAVAVVLCAWTAPNDRVLMASCNCG
jgi:hypothetical protein